MMEFQETQQSASLLLMAWEPECRHLQAPPQFYLLEISFRLTTRPQDGLGQGNDTTYTATKKSFPRHPSTFNSEAKQFCFTPLLDFGIFQPTSPCWILVFSNRLCISTVTYIKDLPSPLDFLVSYLVPKLLLSQTHIPKHIPYWHPNSFNPPIHQCQAESC